MKVFERKDRRVLGLIRFIPSWPSDSSVIADDPSSGIFTWRINLRLVHVRRQSIQGYFGLEQSLERGGEGR